MPPDVYFAIPAMDELEYLPRTLECIARQDYPGKINVCVCVNQPRSDYADTRFRTRIEHNHALWKLLQQNPWKLSLFPIDRFSEGQAWEKKSGVGMARRCCMETLLPQAGDEDILVSMDADTLFAPDYVSCIVRCFEQDRHTAAVTPEYYHRLSGDAAADRALLRYEIYMRCFLIGLLRIRSPYAFTALGSAICCRMGIYRKVGGFDSRQAGEDFYFLQKIAKSGKIRLDSGCTVYPSSRLSDRVPFGTGPAIRDLQASEKRYPIFPPEAFDRIAESYRLIPAFREKDISTPLTDFIRAADGSAECWERMRRNYPTLPAFTRAFHQKADGLRIFQFLRQYAAEHPASDEENLRRTLNRHAEGMHFPDLPEDFRFATAPVARLDEVRDALQKREAALRQLPL